MVKIGNLITYNQKLILELNNNIREEMVIYEPLICNIDIFSNDINSDETKTPLTKDQRQTWQYLKGAKKKVRVAKNGHEYIFSEGAIPMIDEWNAPARTMLTSESTFNRSSHIVIDKKTNKIRIITPIEAERIQGFPDNWTNTGMPERMRYFCMGNALAVPLIERMGKQISKIMEKE